jgi:hypothetical protein
MEPMGIVIMDDIFSDRWTGRRDRVEWTPRSPDLNILDFAFWGLLKSHVFTVKEHDLRHFTQRIRVSCAAAHPNMMSEIHRNVVKQLRNAQSVEMSIQSI